MEKSVSALLGSEIDNPESTFQGSEFELSFSINEDDAGNGLHLILIALAILILPWLKMDNKKELILFEVALLFSILLFSLVFKWQPWGGRLQTPIFLLGCSLSGYFIDKVFQERYFPCFDPDRLSDIQHPLPAAQQHPPPASTMGRQFSIL